MNGIRKLIAHRTIRFGIVGIGNTLLNFLVLNFAFYALGQSKIVSSILATICAVTVSFFLNRNFVFRHREHSLRQPIMFAIVTLTGVLLVQNLVYALFVLILKDHTQGLVNVTHSLTGLRLDNTFFDINLSNLIASLCAMFWNYNGYRLFVFRPQDAKKETESNEEIILPT